MKKKLLAVLVAIALLVAQLPAVSVFAGSGDVVDVMKVLDNLNIGDKSIILSALWNKALENLSGDPAAIDRDSVYADIKASLGSSLWNQIIDESGAANVAAGKLSEEQLKKIIDKILVYAPVFTDFYNAIMNAGIINASFSTHVKAALGLGSSASAGDVFQRITTNYRQPIFKYNDATSKFILNPDIVYPNILLKVITYLQERPEADLTAMLDQLPAEYQLLRDDSEDIQEQVDTLLKLTYRVGMNVKVLPQLNAYVTAGTLTAEDVIEAMKIMGVLKVPGTPANVTATAGNGSVSVSWSAAADASYYRVYYGTSPLSLASFVEAAGTSATVTGLTNGTTYYFAVAACMGTKVWGSASAASSATPYGGGGVIVPPASPSVSPAASISPSPAASPEPSVSTSPVPSVSPSSSPSVSPSPSASPKPSVTPIPGITPRPSPLPTAGTVIIEPVIENGKAEVVVDKDTLVEALAEAPVNSDGVKEIRLALASDEGASQIEAKMDASFFTDPSNNASVVVESNAATVKMSTESLKSLDLAGAKEVSLELNRTDADTAITDPEVRAQIGDRPVIEINFNVDGKPVAWNNESAPITVAIPYSPAGDELSNPDLIVVWYIDSAGVAHSVQASAYDPATGMVYIRLTHMSTYAIAYVDKKFVDIAASWANNEIKAMAARGIINGTSTTSLQYSPKSSIIRADFIKLLVSTLGLTATVDGNFPDVQQGTYYYDSVGIAKKLGIVKGDGKGKFNPKSVITRQDMMVMTARALDVAKKLTLNTDAASLASFNDNAKIAGYAKQSVATLIDAGIIQGSNSNINPLGYFTREEAAAVMYRVFNNYISPVK